MDNLKEGSIWEREDDATIPKSIYSKLAKEDYESCRDFINMKFGRGALKAFDKASIMGGENDYEQGRIDGLIEAVKIFRD